LKELEKKRRENSKSTTQPSSTKDVIIKNVMLKRTKNGDMYAALGVSKSYKAKDNICNIFDRNLYKHIVSRKGNAVCDLKYKLSDKIKISYPKDGQFVSKVVSAKDLMKAHLQYYDERTERTNQVQSSNQRISQNSLNSGKEDFEI
jgi:hypothetical protein